MRREILHFLCQRDKICERICWAPGEMIYRVTLGLVIRVVRAQYACYGKNATSSIIIIMKKVLTNWKSYNLTWGVATPARARYEPTSEKLGWREETESGTEQGTFVSWARRAAPSSDAIPLPRRPSRLGYRVLFHVRVYVYEWGWAASWELPSAHIYSEVFNESNSRARIFVWDALVPRSSIRVETVIRERSLLFSLRPSYVEDARGAVLAIPRNPYIDGRNSKEASPAPFFRIV